MLPNPKISVYGNASPKSFIGDKTVASVVATMRTERFKPPTDTLRCITDVNEARVYKAGEKRGDDYTPGHFLAALWAGAAGKEIANNQGLQVHSGLICIDKDNLSPERIASLVEQLQADPYTHVAFISPSGNGIKVVVRTECQTVQEHRAYYAQLTAYYASAYNLTTKDTAPKGTKPNLDPQCKNPNRLCFLPHDPNAYYNPDSAVMPLLDEYRTVLESTPRKAEESGAKEHFASQEPIGEKTRRLVSDSISQLQQRGIDLTEGYEQWVEIGFAFASMGDEGRIYFHLVSQLNPTYDYQPCDAKFTDLLKTRNGSVTIGTFLRRCEEVMGKTWEQTHREHDNQAQRTAQQWGETTPLKTTLLPVLSVTPDMIPESLRPWLTDIAHRMKCPLDFVASTAVVMLSSLIGTRLTIKPKTRDEWTVVPNLWGAVIGGPSSMKSPSVSEVLKPLTRLALAQRKQFEEEMAAYEILLVDYEAQKKAYAFQAQEKHKGKSIDTPVSYPDAPPKPNERRYMVNDVTVEKLADLLNENPSGLLQIRDELIALLAGWDRSGHEQDRAFHLEAWNGNGQMTIDRIGRGTTHVNVICESLFGGIQPAKLLPYLQAATGYENDGFVQRLQVAVYPDASPWTYVDEEPDKAARDQAYACIQSIAETNFNTIAYPVDDYNKFPFTRFDADAQAVFKEWLTKWETHILPHENGLLLEHFTKYRSLMPSLALLFHVVNCVNLSPPADPAQKQLVSTQAAEMAVDWCNYLMSHARRIYGLLDTVSVEGARTLLQRIQRNQLPDGFKVREVAQKGWSGLATTTAVEAAISELISGGYLREELAAPTGGRPEAGRYRIHPDFLPKQ